jgi:ubiquinol-cytochrome c reductase iron-sulfur subunit
MRHLAGGEVEMSDLIHSGQPGDPDDPNSTGHEPLPEKFENPGLPHHLLRRTDEDPKIEKRAERQVATLFALSAIGTVVMLVAYFAIRLDDSLTFSEYNNRVYLSNLFLGLGLFLALFCIGAGAVHWAKTLMPGEEVAEDRHVLRGTNEQRAEAVAILKQGSAEAGLGRRPLIRNSLVGALGLVGLPAVVLLRDLGPLPGDALSTSMWEKGLRLVRDPEGGFVKASDLNLGSVVHITPEGIEDVPDPLEQKAKAAVLLLRLEVQDIDDAALPGSYEGIVAYSKICTHMGCPVALYEQQSHHLLCPCHQSTFDVTQNCKVIFGPANRPLPQLPITVDDEGYLVAKSGLTAAPGPSFWERG